LGELFSEWKKSVAKEFVKETRFDPLYEAASEQELHDRLPDIIGRLGENESVRFEMKSGLYKHSVTLTRDLFMEKSSLVFADIVGAIESQRRKARSRDASAALLVTHRITRVPGWKEHLAELGRAQIFGLEPGAGAKGAVKITDLFETKSGGRGVSLLTSRPWHAVSRKDGESSGSLQDTRLIPTHMLLRNVAYPISDVPLVVSSQKGGTQIYILKDGEDAYCPHCTIRRQGSEVVLTNFSSSGTLLDGVRITGSTPLTLGQKIQTGESEEKLHLIACLQRDET
jgi:hypothetical protein